MSVLRAPSAILVLLALLGGALPASSSDLGGDCGLGGDVDSFGLTWTVPFTCQGWVTGDWNGDRQDTFHVDVTERVRLGFTIYNSGPDMLLVDLSSPSGNVRSHGALWTGEGGVGAVTDELGIWTLNVRGFANPAHGATYTVNAWSETAPPPVPAQDDCGSGRDTGEDGYFTPAPATIPDGVSCTGAFASHGHPDGYGYDDVDGYQLHLPLGARLVVTVDAPEGVGPLEICSHWGDCAAGDAREGPVTLEHRARRTGDTAFSLRAGLTDLGQHPYSMNVTVVPPEVRTQVQTGMLRHPPAWNPLVKGPGGEIVDGVSMENVSYAWMRLEEPMKKETRFVVRGKPTEPLWSEFWASFYRETPSGLVETSPTCEQTTNEFRCAVGGHDWAGGLDATWVRIDLLLGVDVAYEATYTYWVPR